jgi:hypothetical protein
MMMVVVLALVLSSTCCSCGSCRWRALRLGKSEQ